MARVKLSDELKQAISLLSGKEKDKLLFRLIAKDSALAEKLLFDLVEEGDTKDERREDLAGSIQKTLREYQNYYHSPGYLLLNLRSMSGDISRHVRTTRDKYGEIQLNLLMLNLSLKYFGDKVSHARPNKQHTFSKYVVQRASKLMKLLEKIHEDNHLDFEEDLQQLGKYISKYRYLNQWLGTYPLDLEAMKRGSIY